jgi:ATP-dependent helicase/nuclease subunit A
MLDFEKLDALFASDLYRRMKLSDDLRREMRFNILVDGEKLSPEASGEKILVQGVIDCFFKNPDGTYSVVDYKTDRVTNADILIQRHRTQIDFYADAVADMTGCPVKEKIIYSFEMSKEIKLN